jgi:hypothetical protein
LQCNRFENKKKLLQPQLMRKNSAFNSQAVFSVSLIFMLFVSVILSSLAKAQVIFESPTPAPTNTKPPLNPLPSLQPTVQPLAPTPQTLPPRANESDPAWNGVRGLTNWYAQVGTGFGIDEVSKCDPGAESCNAPISESHYSLLLKGIVGWGPVRTKHFLFNIHYKYNQNWGTDYLQVDRFFARWFDTFKTEDFLFPTKSLLRSHEIAWDMRGLWNPFQAGLFSRLNFGRVGSSFFGEPLEEVETVVVSENFVPYVSYKYDRFYRAQLSSPFRTEINREDPRLSNTTYSFSSKGRGRIFSLKLSNAGFIEPIESLVYLDLSHQQLKYASIQNDRVRNGASASVDFPVAFGIRVVPKLGYFKDEYLVNRPRIPGYTKKKATELINTKAIEVARNDTFLTLGLSVNWSIDDNSKLDLTLSRESNTSTLSEFNITRNELVLGYTYSWPTQSTVSKRVDRFTESPYAEEF